MRILLVEDDDMIGQAVQEALESNAYAVDWVQDGARALDAISEVPYDCALLDLGLPKVDGIKVLEYWRSQKIKTPVIILTGQPALHPPGHPVLRRRLLAGGRLHGLCNGHRPEHPGTGPHICPPVPAHREGRQARRGSGDPVGAGAPIGPPLRKRGAGRALKRNFDDFERKR